MSRIELIKEFFSKLESVPQNKYGEIATYLQNIPPSTEHLDIDLFLIFLAKVPSEKLSDLNAFLDSLMEDTPSERTPISFTENEYYVAKSWLCDYFENNIKKYVITDLIVLQNIPDKLSENIEVRDKINNDALGYCTIPQAMTVFSCMDILGFLLRPDTSQDDLSLVKKQTSENIKYFLNQYYVRKGYIIENDIKPLTSLYRHGLMHQFFPKSVNIHKTPVRKTQPPFQVISYTVGKNGGSSRRHCLNVSDFTECFLSALNDIRQDFDSEDDIIKQRNYNMYLKWIKLCESDEKEASRQQPPSRKLDPSYMTTIQVSP